MRRLVFDTILVWGALLLLPPGSSAQGTSTGAITGTVKDTSGAVLPGVTVEAASPALIERIRTAITDDKGDYKIIELRPGTYTVTFTLPGFNTFKRDGIELPPNFTASINASLAVGAIQETVTVSGTTPLIDTQNVTQQRTFSRQLLDAVPTAKSMLGIAALMPSVVEPPNAQDVGGTKGERSVRLSVHGSKTYDSRLLQDGMRYNALTPGIGPPTAPTTLFVPSLEGTGRGYYINPLAAEETLIDTGSLGSAQYEYGGAQVNMIPKDGGNIFSGSLFVGGTGHRLQSNNLTDDLQRQGLTSVNAVRQVYDFNGAFGGRIVKDRIWFFGAARRWGTTTAVANLYADANLSARGIGTSAASWRYAADLANPIYPAEIDRAAGIRFTVKPTAADKFTVSYDRQRNFQDQLTGQLENGTIKNEANAGYCQSHTVLQGTWTRPATRLLLDAGATVSRFNFGGFGDDLYLSDYQSCGGGLVGNVLINDTGFGYTYNGVGNRNMALSHQMNSRFNLSYLKGGHSIKTGLFLMYGLNGGHTTYFDRSPAQINGLPLSYVFVNGAPRSLTQFAAPTYTLDQLNPDLGLFIQDQWRAGRFTINAGLRLDWIHESVPAISEPAGPLVAARSFDAVDNVPNWKDLNPRFGIAWDPFGDGKTAIKAGINRYVLSNTTGIANFFDPANASVNSTTRSWTDANGDFLPDCNLKLTTANDECGAMANQNFGGLVVTNTPDPDWVTGWRKRPYMWQTGVGIDREVRPNISVSVGYYHTTYGNFYVLDNTLVSPTDYSGYCVTAPSDPRLPASISGQPLCGLADVNPDKFGLNRSIVTLSSNFGKQSEVYDGVDLTMNARLRKLTVTGGWNIGDALQTGIAAGGTASARQNNCFVVDSPQQLYNCDVKIPFQNRVKFSASYILPHDVQFATVVQSAPGPTYNANVTYTAAQIQPSLGRVLSGGTATTTINVLPPFSQFGDRINQVDLRGGKIFRMGRKRIQANVDLYNLFSISPVLNYNSTYGTFGSATAGAVFLQPTQILDGRLVKFSFQLDF